MKDIQTITRTDCEKPHKPVRIAGQWNKISTQSLRNTKQSANHISWHSITQLPEHYSKMRHVPLGKKRNPPTPRLQSDAMFAISYPPLWFQLQGKCFSLQNNPHAKQSCKYLLVSWHLPPLVDHPLCCVCCGCDAVTAASCSVDVDDCCWHQESSSTNNKTQPTPAEMQSNFHDVSNFVFSSPSGHLINIPQACHLQVLILNTCK